jgi:hypothetical protein
MVAEVYVRPHRREQRNGVKREARKAASDFKTGARGVGRDFKSGWKREFGRRPRDRVTREFYVRGVKGEDAQSIIAHGTGKKDARDLFRDKYPGYRIVQLNERE